MTDDAAVLGVTDRLRCLVSGQQVLLGKAMVGDVVRDAANDHVLVSTLRQHGKVFADLHSRDVR